MNIEDLEKLDNLMCEIIEDKKPNFPYKINQEQYKAGQVNALQRIMRHCIEIVYPDDEV